MGLALTTMYLAKKVVWRNAQPLIARIMARRRTISRVAKVIVGIVLVLVLGRNIIARKLVEVGVTKATGFPLEIGSVHTSLRADRIEVRNLRLMNPPDFEDKMFVEMPQFILSYVPSSLLRGRPHVKLIQINIRRVVIVKTASGESNVQRLKGIADKAGKGKQPKKPDQAKPAKKARFRVDELRIHVGTVAFKDYSSGKLKEKTYNVNFGCTYHGINDSTSITQLALATIMSQVDLPDIGVDTDALTDGLGSAAEAIGEAGEGLFNKIGEALE